MNFNTILDIAVFIAFIAAVVFVGLYKSRGEGGSEDYFLAGRGLTWWLIGISLIAANISTEQFVGMSGSAAGISGLAIASYEWMAAITLVFVAFLFLPKFLKSGIYTVPQFLEFRFDALSRSVMSFMMVIVLVLVNVTAVIYSGATVADTVFGHSADLPFALDLEVACWGIGIIAAVYVCAGRLEGVRVGRPFAGHGSHRRRHADCVLRLRRVRGKARGGNRNDGYVHAAGSRLAQRRGHHRKIRIAQLRQTNNVHARRPLRNSVDCPHHRPVDSQFLLLGLQPVHHSAHARRVELGGRTKGHHACGGA